MIDSTRLLAILSLALMVTAAAPPRAESDRYLIYPHAWCETGVGEPLHFTKAELGIDRIDDFTDPHHGRVFFDPEPIHGGYYLPQCTGLTHAGFDFFQLESDGERIHVVVLLGDGQPVEHEASEAATGGQLGDPWILVRGDPRAGVEIVEWPPGHGMEGTHGFQITSGQPADSYLSFRFADGTAAFQPPSRRGKGNNGVETKITIRPPLNPFMQQGAGLSRQMVYATGSFGGSSPPDTALWMQSQGGMVSVQAEAASTSGPVATAWCNLTPGFANQVYIHHQQALDGTDDSLLLRIGPEGNAACEDEIGGFVSARPPGSEHRFGVMEPYNGGLAYDFDELEIGSIRYAPELERRLADDFEAGDWSPSWEAVNPVSLNVASNAAHTGDFGLEIRPGQGISSHLRNPFPVASDQLACRLSLDATLTSPGELPAEMLVFAAGAASEFQVRLTVRKEGSSYQLRAWSGPTASDWLSLNRFPAVLDLRFDRGLLEFWIQGCGPHGNDCGVGHRVESAAGHQAVAAALLGAIDVPQQIDGVLTLDDVLCLVERSGP